MVELRLVSGTARQGRSGHADVSRARTCPRVRGPSPRGLCPRTVGLALGRGRQAGLFPKPWRRDPKMDCIAHTHAFSALASCPPGNLVRMDCLAPASFTHPRCGLSALVRLLRPRGERPRVRLPVTRHKYWPASTLEADKQRTLSACP